MRCTHLITYIIMFTVARRPRMRRRSGLPEGENQKRKTLCSRLPLQPPRRDSCENLIMWKANKIKKKFTSCTCLCAYTRWSFSRTCNALNMHVSARVRVYNFFFFLSKSKLHALHRLQSAAQPRPDSWSLRGCDDVYYNMYHKEPVRNHAAVHIRITFSSERTSSSI